MKKQIQSLVLIPFSLLSIFTPPSSGEHLLAEKEFSLENRYPDKWVNDVFKDNILLNLAYLNGSVTSKENIKWDEVNKPFDYQFTLPPNKTFAFHEDIEDKYRDSLVKTTNTHFNYQEGFKTDGYLFGDGVCHLASLLFWLAKDAGLETEAPTNHDFMNIPSVPKEYGVSIYSNPYALGSNTRQNLYITNNKGKPITFKFEYKDNKIKVAILD